MIPKKYTCILIPLLLWQESSCWMRKFCLKVVVRGKDLDLIGTGWCLSNTFPRVFAVCPGKHDAKFYLYHLAFTQGVDWYSKSDKEAVPKLRQRNSHDIYMCIWYSSWSREPECSGMLSLWFIFSVVYLSWITNLWDLQVNESLVFYQLWSSSQLIFDTNPPTT